MTMRTTRRLVQLGFLLLTVVGVYLVRGHAERWCPFGGVEAIYGYINNGNMICSLGVSNFYILGGVLVMALIARRAFCGYMCPIGTLSEWLGRIAARLGLKPANVPYRLDRALALLKYAVLGLILYFTWRTSELVFRGYDPCYAFIGRHGEDITIWAYLISGAIVLASLALVLPFCRWLCPLAAVLAPFSRFGLTRIKRESQHCLDCGECNRACPMGIRVDATPEVTAARCIACMECVQACPEQGENVLSWGPPRGMGGRWPQWALVAVLLAVVGAAVAATYVFPLPSFVWSKGEPPERTRQIELHVNNVNCRGNASLLVYFLERDDELELDGYLKLEAWPGPDPARIQITFDPTRTNDAAILQALAEPYFDLVGGFFRASPFHVVAVRRD